MREVVLFDERDVIGGELAVATAAPNRPGWGWLLEFYAARSSHGVELRLGTPAAAGDLDGFEDVVLASEAPRSCRTPRGRARAAGLARASGGALGGRSLLVVDDGFGWWYFASAVELGVRAGFQKITVVTPGAAFGSLCRRRPACS